jgi:glutathionylspermidine synthase
MLDLKKQFQEVRPSYVRLTQKEIYKDIPTEDLRSLFLEELQQHFSRGGSNSDLSYPTELNMNRNELIKCSIEYHKMLLEAIDEQLRIDEKWFPTSK